MRRLLPLALFTIAACSRSFVPPVASGPHIDAVDDHGGAFAGQPVVLHGSGFATESSSDHVSVEWASGVVSAVVLDDPAVGSPSETTLEIAEPDLGEATSAQVSVTVEGRTSNAAPLAFRGPGHPAQLKLATDADLSPTLTSASVLGGVAAVTLLRNRVAGLVLSGSTTPATFPLGADPLVLPFASQLLPAPGADGGFNAFSLWIGAFDVHIGPHQRIYRARGGEAAAFALAPWVDALLPFSPMAVGENGLQEYLPTLDGKVVSYASGADLLDQRPDVVSRDPQQLLGDFRAALVTSSSELVATGVDGGGVAAVTFEAAVLSDGSGQLYLDELASPGQALPAPLALTDANSGVQLVFPDVRITALAVAPGDSPGAPPTEAYATATTAAGGALLLVVDLQTGATTRVPLPFAADEVAVTQVQGRNRLALASVSAPLVYLFSTDALSEPTAVVNLPGLPFTLTRDQDPSPDAGDAFYAVITSPPTLVELDPQTGGVLSRTPFDNQLRMAAMNRDGSALAVAATRLPSLAIVDGQTLQEDDAGFQHAAPPGQLETTVAGAAAFRDTPDGGEELCAELVQLSIDGGVQPRLRCGPPDAILTGEGSCELLSGELTAGLDPLSPPKLLTLEGGRMLVFGSARSWSCAPGCGGCTDLGRAHLPVTLATGTGDGGLFAFYGQQLVSIDLDGGMEILCAAADPRCADNNSKAIAVDPRGLLLSVLGQGPVLYDLTGANPPARIPYFSDIPTAQAFSPDGQRIYVSTVLGHVDEYDVSSGHAPFERVRTLFAGFPITQIVAYPDGSRLLLGEQNSDRLHVVQ